MATGGGRRIQKGYEEQKFCVKRFAYDVLFITLSKCGFPETHLRVKFDKENEYRHSDYVITVHSTVMNIAFCRRDEWKRMFEYKQKSFVLNDMRKVEEYLAKIEVLPEFRQTEGMDKVLRSLAFYSELILFLHFKNIEVDFEKLLDIWSRYYNEKIAVNVDSDLLLEAVFLEEPDIVGYLSLVDCFIKEEANPYGKIDDVTKRFRKFYEDMDKFYEEIKSCVADYSKIDDDSERFRDFSEDVEEIYEESEIGLAELSQELLACHLKSTLHNPLDPPKAVKKSASFSPAIILSDSVLSGICTSLESPEHPHTILLPSSSSRAGEDISERKCIISEEALKERDVGDAILPGHSKSPEPTSESATGGIRRIQKGYEAQKFSVKRFAYDVLYITLSKCCFPETHLRVKFDKENDYRHSEYVITVHSEVMCIAFSMRDKWKRMFEYKQKSFVLNNMRKVEEYLAKIEVLPEFRPTDDLDKIRMSLAFYSELILFLHSNKIKVDFEKLLDVWSSYFNEKIAVNEDSDVLLEAIFIEELDVVGYLRFVDCFILEYVIPYGKTDDVSERFRYWCDKVNTFYAGPSIDFDEIWESITFGRRVANAS